MRSFADVVDLLAYELAGLGARRLAGALVATRPLERFTFRHGHVPPQRGTQLTYRVRYSFCFAAASIRAPVSVPEQISGMI